MTKTIFYQKLSIDAARFFVFLSIQFNIYVFVKKNSSVISEVASQKNTKESRA